MIYFKPLHEDDLQLLYQWFQEPTINQLYARGQAWSLKDIENKYLPRLTGHDNVPSFIIYSDHKPINLKPLGYEWNMVYMSLNLVGLNKELNQKTLLHPRLVPASINDYPTIQNMARFYVYDMSRYCGFISDDWACPKDGLYESFDFKNYFEDPTRKAFLVYVDKELAGFVLLNQAGISPTTQWNMGEFFILAKFQGKGVASQVAKQLWKTHPGQWEVSVIPQNSHALAFWSKTIAEFTNHVYSNETINVDYEHEHPSRHILTFNT